MQHRESASICLTGKQALLFRRKVPKVVTLEATFDKTGGNHDPLPRPTVSEIAFARSFDTNQKCGSDLDLNFDGFTG